MKHIVEMFNAGRLICLLCYLSLYREWYTSWTWPWKASTLSAPV